jgi:hypothetical protein
MKQRKREGTYDRVAMRNLFNHDGEEGGNDEYFRR